MTTSVPVDERTRARLERLRAAVEREIGRTVTHQELLARMVAREVEDRDSLVDSFRSELDDQPREEVDPPSGDPAGESVDDEFEGLTEAEKERWLSGTSDWGFETTEAEVDEILYGGLDEFAEDGFTPGRR